MPTYSVDVGPTVINPTHHLGLIAEDGTELGIILCDAIGKRLSTAIARSNLQTMPVKVSSGDSKYSDGELPFVVSAQQDFSGGLGQERFEDNRSKYRSGARMQTVGEKAVLGPREHFAKVMVDGMEAVISQPATGHPVWDQGQIGRLKWTQSSTPNKIATKFTTGYAVGGFEMWLFGKPEGDAYIGGEHRILWEIRNDDAGGSEPGTLVSSGQHIFTTSNRPDRLMAWQETGLLPDLAAATSYWLALYPHEDAGATNHVQMGFWLDPDNNATLGLASSVTSNDLGVTWGAYPDSDYQLMFRIEPTKDPGTGWFFFYREQLYWISHDQTEPPTLLMNGWRGVCDAGATNKLFDATQTGTGWANDGAKGLLVWIFAGPGSDEEEPFRYIRASEDGELSVDHNWEGSGPTNESEYVILGSDKFFPVTHTIPHSPTGRPAVAVGGDPPNDEQAIVYFPQGHDQSNPNYQIWMFRQYNNAGVFTTESKGINDGTGGAGDFRSKLIITVQDDTKGPILVKIEDNNAKGAAGIVAEARAPGTWTEQLGWGGDERLGDELPSSLINAIEYADPKTEKRVAWAFTRDEMYAREGGEIPSKWASVLLPELKKFASERTGYALAVYNTSLYLTLSGGLLERLTGGNTLTDVGPNKGAGLPEGRAGEISALATYPGSLFVAIKSAALGGMGLFSTIAQLRGLDSYDSIYESSRNRDITDIAIQRMTTLTGTSFLPPRLWFQEEYNLMWLDLPHQGTTPLTDPAYQFATEGYVESSRIYANLDDKIKVYSSLKVVSDGLQAAAASPGRPDGIVWIDGEYEVDGDNPASGLAAIYGGRIDESPSQEVNLTNYDNDQVAPLRGKYIRTRLRMNSTKDKETPEIRGFLIESLLGLPNKFSFKTTVLFEDNQLDLRNDSYTDTKAWQQAGRLEEYAEQLEVFTLKAPSSTLDGAKVIISPPEVAPLAISENAVTTEAQATEERLIGTLSIIQVVLPDLGLV